MILKDLGLGPSLYLLTLKAFGKLFLGITILNLPVMYFFMCGTENKSPHLNLLQRMFTTLSIGNLGELGPNCESSNLAINDTTFELSCTSGVLDRLDSFGLINTPN